MYLIRSPNPSKKFRAVFSDGSHIDFGASAYEDYTQHHDKERRRLYWKRHAKDLRTENPQSAGYLSLFLLWGDSTNLNTNLKRYKQMFHIEWNPENGFL